MAGVQLGGLHHFVCGPCTSLLSQSQLTSSPEGKKNYIQDNDLRVQAIMIYNLSPYISDKSQLKT
jgi:hypothetical protein